MFTRILVPLDGSPIAEKALPHARALGRALEIPITLIAVIETAAEFSANKAPYTLIEDSVSNAEKYLEKISRTFSGAAIQSRVEKGKAEEAIIINAAADNGTLITMASHGRSGFGRWLLGSVAEKVVHCSARRLEPGRIRSPVCRRIGKGFPCEGHALARIQPETDHLQFRAISSRSGWTQRSIEMGSQDLSGEKAAELKSRGLIDVFCSVTEGDAPETIIEMGKGAPRTLIAMPTHGGSMIKHWVLGSVTEKVLRHANNPVLTIRT